MVDLIQNRDTGLSAREKINTVIANTNAQSLTSFREYDSVEAMKAETAAIADGTQVRLRSYYGDGGMGGGMLVYDAASTDTADDGRVFAPALGGRFKRPKGSHFKASEHGLIDSQSTDQHARIQDWITAAVNEDWTAYLDLSIVNAAGGEIWVNGDGAEGSYAGTDQSALVGCKRRNSTIRNAFVTFGTFYDDAGTDDPRYSIDRGSAVNVLVENMQFNGAVRFVNLENNPVIKQNGFFAETGNGTFWDSIPAGWGQNISGRTDLDGDPVATVAYSDFTHIVELINCNHMHWENNNVQNGSSVTNIAGDTLGGMQISGHRNGLFTGGRITSVRQCMRFGTHPIYGGSINNNIIVQNMHPENVTHGAIDILGGEKYYINTYGPPDGTWDGTDPFIRLADVFDGAKDVEINCHFDGNGATAGQFLDVRNVDGLKVGGFVKDCAKGIRIRDGINVHQPTTIFENVGSTAADEVTIDVGVTKFTRDDFPV